jgi:hypothetical protein
LRVTNRSEQEALLASTSRKALQAGWYDSEITEAAEKLSAKGKPMIEVVNVVEDGAGGQRTIKDYFNDSDMAAARVRSAVIAVGALAAYESGTLSPEMFTTGKKLQVLLRVQKGTRAYPGDRNMIEEYRAAPSSVVNLRPAS